MSILQFACAYGRFYHSGGFSTESLDCIHLVGTCGTVGRLDIARLNSVVDELYVCQERTRRSADQVANSVGG